MYQGISSQCDHPLVRGGLKAFDQHTGTLVAVYHSVPSGAVGASIWSTAAASPDGKLIFVTTGNADPQGSDRGDSYSIVALDAATLAKRDIWTISTIVKPVRLLIRAPIDATGQRPIPSAGCSAARDAAAPAS